MIRELLLRRSNWDSTAVMEDGETRSYRDLARRAAGLCDQLTKASGTVALFLPNGGDYIAALFGILQSGRTAFPLSVQLTVHELAPLLSQASVDTVVTSTAFQPLFQGIFGGRILCMEELSEGESPVPAAPGGSPEEVMVLLNTSGTTSRAKLVQLSDKNVETAVMGYLSYIDYTSCDEANIRYLLATPYSSVYGLLILSVCLVKSFPLVVTKGVFNLDTLYRAAQESKVTHYEGGTSIPILMDQMAGRPIQYDISSLRFIGFGGSMVSAEILTRLSAAYPALEFAQGYGMTESASLIARHVKRMEAARYASVGTAIPGVAIAVDAGGALTSAPFVTGEVVAKGPNVMLGYENNKAETEAVIQNGALYTGDIGYLDEEGYLYLCGRKKNVIMVRGFSVYAEEVEDCLINSGLVEDCVVYGGRDTFQNEIVCADVVPAVPQEGTEALRLYCAKHLADYKQPQRIRVVTSIHKTATGKAERRSDGAD